MVIRIGCDINMGISIEDKIRKLSDEDLIRCILEIKEWHEVGILKKGLVREIQKSSDIELYLKTITDAVLIEGSLRFIKGIKCYQKI